MRGSRRRSSMTAMRPAPCAATTRGPARWLATLVLCLAALPAACSTAAPSRPPAPRLRASATQFRPDEGTTRLHAGVTNLGRTAVTVTSATVVWPGFAWPTVRLPRAPVPVGQTAAFVIRYGAAHCHVGPGPAYLRAEVDGRSVRLRLRVQDPALLSRLHAHECARRRLAATAGLALRLRRHTVVRGGEEYLPGTVLLRRRPGARSTVTVVDVGGSVLFDLAAAPGAGRLPARLAPGAPQLRVPMRIGSAHRCDPHARGNSSQTFLFSVYTRLAGEPVQRSVFVPGPATRRRLDGLLDRACRG